jgi:hypothetical protein
VRYGKTLREMDWMDAMRCVITGKWKFSEKFIVIVTAAVAASCLCSSLIYSFLSCVCLFIPSQAITKSCGSHKPEINKPTHFDFPFQF